MQLTKIYARIKLLKQPIFQTRDIVALLNLPVSTISRALARLAKEGHLLKLSFGLWGLPDQIEPLMLPEYLTAPFPSYVSLQSALYYHGMIEQIPEIIYAVSLARTRRFSTPLGNFSIHHIIPKFYFGYTIIGEKNIKIATPEKALLDFLYLSPAKSGWFVSLPELELPKSFDYKLCRKWVNKIPHPRRRTLVLNRLISIMRQ